MFKQLALCGAILLSLTSCLSKTNNSLSISQIHTKASGSYLVHGTCYNRNGYVSISDNTGSIRANGNVRCYGTYGAARIRKQGTNTQVVKFNPIRTVDKTYKVKAFKPGGYAVINKDGNEHTVKVIGKGLTPFVIKTSEGYERL